MSGNWKHISTEAEIARTREFTAKYIEKSKRLESVYGENARGRVTYNQISKDLGKAAKVKTESVGETIDFSV